MIYLIQHILDSLDAKFKTSLGFIILWVITLLTGTFIGLFVSYRKIQSKFEEDAIREGVAVYVCDSKTGNCKFTFILPVKLKPITGN
jgi:hypothetical protein